MLEAVGGVVVGRWLTVFGLLLLLFLLSLSVFQSVVLSVVATDAFFLKNGGDVRCQLRLEVVGGVVVGSGWQ